MITVLYLYLIFRIKQFACDFLFQTNWMANMKGKPGPEGYKALFAHTGIHAFATLLIILAAAPALWWLAAVDFAVHSFVDRIKGRITDAKKWGPEKRLFWIAFGLDQEAHNLTHLVYVLVIADHLDIIQVPLPF